MTDATTPKTFVERGLALFQDLIRADPKAARRFALSRAEFFGGRRPKDVDAELRHLEWFLSECFVEEGSGVAAEELLDAFRDRADETLASFAMALQESFASVFQVTGVQPERGIWIQDTTAGGEYPLVEPEAAGEFTEGDLIVGRIYPLGDGSYRASPSAAVFRDHDLLDALHSDIVGARETRRGTPRLSQAVLESVFFAAQERPAAPSMPGGSEGDETVSWLRAICVDEDQCEAILSELRAHPIGSALDPADDERLARILSELPLNDPLEIEQARRALIAAWSSMERKPREPGAAPSQAEVMRALAEFDRARADGGDIDLLFDKLERDLGIETGDGDEAGDVAPDFPGVVGAVVDEFVWDRGRTDPDRLPEYEILRKLAEFGQPIGIFEELGPDHLLEFASCRILQPGVLAGPEEARLLLQVLADFCRWADESHGLGLVGSFAPSLASLQQSVPRLIAANQHVAPAAIPPEASLFEVTECRPDAFVARANGTVRRFDVPSDLAAHVRPGDLLRVSFDADGSVHGLRFYPAQAAGSFVRTDAITPPADLA